MVKLCKKCGRVIEDEAQNLCDDCQDNTSLQRPSAPKLSEKKSNFDWLAKLLNILADLSFSLFGIGGAAVAIAFEPEIYGSVIVDVIVFLLFGVIGFALLMSLSLFVKAANKYMMQQ